VKENEKFLFSSQQQEQFLKKGTFSTGSLGAIM